MWHFHIELCIVISLSLIGVIWKFMFILDMCMVKSLLLPSCNKFDILNLIVSCDCWSSYLIQYSLGPVILSSSSFTWFLDYITNLQISYKSRWTWFNYFKVVQICIPLIEGSYLFFFLVLCACFFPSGCLNLRRSWLVILRFISKEEKRELNSLIV